MNVSLDAVLDHRLVPVLVVRNVERAAGLAEALVEGGLPVAEVTMRTPSALEVVLRMAATPGLLVGAGTVLTPGQVDDAVTAGAKFIVSPGFDEGVVRRAQQHGVPVLPGVATPSEVMAAYALGVRVMKFFPAGLSGGPKMVRALGSVFGDVSFVPTGGVSLDNLDEYLALPQVAAVGGTWIAPPDVVDAGDFDRVRAACREAVARVGGAR